MSFNAIVTLLCVAGILVVISLPIVAEEIIWWRSGRTPPRRGQFWFSRTLLVEILDVSDSTVRAQVTVMQDTERHDPFVLVLDPQDWTPYARSHRLTPARSIHNGGERYAAQEAVS